MRVLVIETQRMVPLGALASPLIEEGVELVYWRTTEEPPPAALKDIVGVIALDGVANPDQGAQYPWLDQERRLLREALERPLPAIGLLPRRGAPRPGARRRIASAPATTNWLVPPSALSAPAPMRSGGSCQPRFAGFEWHSHQMTPPPGATLIAGAEQSPQTFSWADFACAFQFHVETNERLIGDWVAHYRDELPRYGIDSTTLLRETRRRVGAYETVQISVARGYAQRLKTAVLVRGGGPT
jgi:GMP synthase-like glutamine amidotransferase